MISIQTNVAAMYGLQNLNKNQMNEQNTIEQMTSGYQINSSADNPAGLAIANTLRNQEAQLNQGVANGNDAVGQLQIIDGGATNISQILDRLQTLAVQGSSSTFTGNFQTLANEFNNDLQEITRQATNIGMNGTVASVASAASAASVASAAAVGTTPSVASAASAASVASVASAAAGIFATALTIYIGGGLGYNAAQLGTATESLTLSGVDSSALGLSSITVNTGATANNSSTFSQMISIIAAAVTQLASVQGTVGASINRLNFSINLAQSQVTNYAAAQSQIRDANMAQEATNLSQQQVLMQSSMAALAQANQIPQGVLKLMQ
ncbi:MAG: flagellin [Bryobacteraceae bacterium]